MTDFIRRTPSETAVDDCQELNRELREIIQRSRVVGYNILARLFDENQLGIVAQMMQNIDVAMERAPLAENKTRRRVVQKLARLHELQNVIAASRNFCRHVVTPGTPFDEALPAGDMPAIAAQIPTMSNGDIEGFVNASVEAIERNLNQALRITVQSFSAALVRAEGRSTQIQDQIDRVGLPEGANRRQAQTSLVYTEAFVRELNRIIAYFQTILASVVPHFQDGPIGGETGP